MSEQETQTDELPTFEYNRDGSVIVKLAKPITYRGTEYARLTIPALRAKHVKLAPFKAGEHPTMGEMVEFASKIVEPIGVLDELSIPEGMKIAAEVAIAFQKSAR